MLTGGPSGCKVSYMTTTTIKGKTVSVGDELLICYGRGTQKVRVREITARGGVLLDRLVGGIEWRSSNTVVTQNDVRWL